MANDVFVDSILKMIELHSTRIINEDNQCEQRVNFFLLISTASIGALAYFFQETTYEISYPTIIIVLFILLLFGLTTLNRLNTRVVNLRAGTELMEEALKLLSKKDIDLENYVKYLLDHIEPRRSKKLGTGWLRRNIKGSLAEFMYLSNGLLCSSIVFFSTKCFNLNESWIFFWTALTFFVSIIVLWRGSVIMRKEGRLFKRK